MSLAKEMKRVSTAAQTRAAEKLAKNIKRYIKEQVAPLGKRRLKYAGRLWAPGAEDLLEEDGFAVTQETVMKTVSETYYSCCHHWYSCCCGCHTKTTKEHKEYMVYVVSW